MQYPKITIVTPNFNKGKYLESTIKSILSQNYPNLEYIIIDGGSTDNSIDIIKKYEKYLTYWVSEPDNGMYHAIQKGFNYSSGEIMAWLNSDDMYHPKSLFTVAEIFSQYSMVNWLIGASSFYDKTGRTVKVNRSRYYSRYNFLTGDWKWIQQETTFWRRNLWEKVNGLNHSLKLAGDFDLWLRFSRYDKMYITDALIGGFRMSDSEQLSDNMDEYINEVEMLIKNEPQSVYDKQKINDVKIRKFIIKLISNIRVFNTYAIYLKLMKSEFQERENHHFSFNKELQKFILP